jgi:outer membrane protein OmpA-like peptidoglycan-associated protein
MGSLAITIAALSTAPAPTLDPMAEYLKAYAAVKVFIVGRSHNQGTLARNLQLSQQRAAAVVAAPRT